MHVFRLIAGAAITLVLLVGIPNAARADKGDGFQVNNDTTSARASTKRVKSSQTGFTSSRTNYSGKPFTGTYVPKAQYKKRMTAYEKTFKAAVTYNTQIDKAWDTCVNNVQAFGCNRGIQRALPQDPNIRAAGKPAAANAAPPLPPEYLAYVAVARLKLNAPTPGIGPSPDLNRWKMAVVGYPLWIWAEGNTNPAPVSDSVYDISVSLKAHLTKVVFDMGDGTKVSCTNLNQKWHRGMEAAIPSKACGHTYTQPSLPKGNYTITANSIWAVDWTINGATGTIPMYQTTTTELAVGELQVLVR